MRLFSTCLEADSTRASQAAQGGSVRSSLWEISRKSGHLSLMKVLKGKQRFVNAKFLERHNWIENAQAHKLSSGVTFHEIDAISMIHVIQHIPTNKVLLWLDQARQMLRRNGLLILATTLANTSALSLEGRAGDLTPASFNAIASGSTASPSIPVRYYTAPELRSLLRAVGFRILEQAPFVYHICTHAPESQFVIATPATSRKYESPPDPPADALYLSEPMRPSIRRQRALRAGYRRRCRH